ncbi:MAG: urease accessory protein UreD [Gammaproteobacteria bacterium]|jgi:urease accessory protein|nr:urease accessory protein UreD [Gammaproteobacteria bacterium]MDP6973863.1 urease accessory protein UreD [Gammaproteobacteria bacterium]HJP12209.1 urease accessory protein UreD [Gammaproteobacteria bacterium]
MDNSAQNGWIAELELRFSKSKSKTFLSTRKHIGPLTIQRPFYPEGDLCHLYLLHPPGGIVGGDQLSIEVNTDSNSSSLLTTPGATKVYRTSDHKHSTINQNFIVAENSSFEWLPMETIVFPGANSQFSSKLLLSGNARVAAWEVYCLGRPAINESFDFGSLKFSLELWRDGIPILFDKLMIDKTELGNTVGLRSFPVFGTFIISKTNKKVLETVRTMMIETDSCVTGVTQIEDIIIVRSLAKKTYLMQDLFKKIWQTVRPLVFNREATIPRIWAT